ncbi:MAG TPA: hypothetical protein VF183_06595 [Acidimicrobiales bacterium]
MRIGRARITRAVIALSAIAATVTGCADDGGEHETAPVPSSPAPTSPDANAPSITGTTGAPAPVLDAICAGETVVDVARRLPDELNEVSGIVASRTTPGWYWAVEDSGNRAVLEGFDLAGDAVHEVRVLGVLNVDWEDVAIGPGPDGRDLVWIADTGDNLGFRPSVSLLRFAEPALDTLEVQPSRVEATFEDGPRDAEALVVATSGVWLFEKTDTGPSGVYRLDTDARVFRRVGEVDVRPASITGADLSVDGRVLALRTNRDLRLFRVDDGDVATAVRETPCVVTSLNEVQGESVAFDPTGERLVTVGERGRQDAPVDVHVIGG